MNKEEILVKDDFEFKIVGSHGERDNSCTKVTIKNVGDIPPLIGKTKLFMTAYVEHPRLGETRVNTSVIESVEQMKDGSWRIETKRSIYIIPPKES